MKKQDREFIKLLVRLTANPPEIDPDQIVREFAEKSGFPPINFRTQEQIVAYRKRSAASKKGWAKRQRKSK